MMLREMAPGVVLQNASSRTPDQMASGSPEQPAALKEETVGVASATLAAARRRAMSCMIEVGRTTSMLDVSFYLGLQYGAGITVVRRYKRSDAGGNVLSGLENPRAAQRAWWDGNRTFQPPVPQMRLSRGCGSRSQYP
jgi:hypothetical protein